MYTYIYIYIYKYTYIHMYTYTIHPAFTPPTSLGPVEPRPASLAQRAEHGRLKLAQIAFN